MPQRVVNSSLGRSRSPLCIDRHGSAVAGWQGRLRVSSPWAVCAAIVGLFITSAAAPAAVMQAESVRTQAQDPLDVLPNPGADYWGQVYNINGKNYTLGEIGTIVNQLRPKYGGEIVCASKDVGVCCPAYCCSVASTVHELSAPMDMSFKDTQTAFVSGSFQIVSQQWPADVSSVDTQTTFRAPLLPQKDLYEHGTFAALLVKTFTEPVYGGWTIEVTFSKAVLDLHSYNAQIVGTSNGSMTYYLRPLYWNRDITAGRHELLVMGLTTPGKLDLTPLDAHGGLYYNPNLQPEPPAPRVPRAPHHPGPRPVPPPPAVQGERYNLAEVMQLSLLFYESQRAGKLPHNQRIKWRGDSAMKDGADVGVDLLGGWFDAGDNIKLGWPMSYSATMLLWGMQRYRDAWEAAGQWEEALEGVKWALDYFVKAHVDHNELYVQTSDEVDHCYWMSPEHETYTRRSYKVTCDNPGSQPVMATAAALAAGAIVFRDTDQQFAATMLQHAVELFAFAERCPGDYIVHGRIPAAGMYDNGGSYIEEHAWAAAWLHKATGNATYLDIALDYYWRCCSVHQGIDDPWHVLSWAHKGVGVNLLLYEALRWDDLAEAITSHIDSFMARVPRTPKGLSYLTQWGANRYAANAAFTALVAADLGLHRDPYREYAVSQVYYMLGDCCDGQASHVVGFGRSWPTSVHHRASSCNGTRCRCTSAPNTHTLWGALIGGPSADDDLSGAGCPDFIHFEVACDYNAGFTSAVAAIKQLSLRGQLPFYDKRGGRRHLRSE